MISCSTSKFVQESPGSEDVNLVTSVDQNECEYIGEVKDKVKGYSDGFLGTSEENLIQQVKMRRLKKTVTLL